MQRRDRGIAQSLGLPLTKRVKESRVLLVGAGGIGCEVLKNLVCCGFGSVPRKHGAADTEHDAPGSCAAEIVVVDLDTIDLSNLNRQFLFRKQHIKKPKAFVAKETASQFNPSVKIEAHHASIFDPQYSVDFFETFDLVFNALDNLAARRHVNRMCLAANVTLIESGTTGFNGQVQAIRKGVTECYDCNPKPVQKSFPVCTIRSTPSQPIHCIVWAKSYLFPELFGTSEEDSADMAVTDGDNAEEVAKLKQEAEALKKIRSLMGKSEFAQEVFNKVFHDDIERLRGMSEMWQSRRPPESLKYENLKSSWGEEDIITRGQALAVQDQSTWSLNDNVAVFAYALDTLSSRNQAGENVIEFDKDDKETLDLVASAANLRSHIFGIPLHSEWEIKQMAGNIIPAIATSNALTASLCVLEAFKILRRQGVQQNGPIKPTANGGLPTTSQNTVSGKDERLLGGAKMVFLNPRSTERMITTQNLTAPRPECPVCSPVYAKLLLSEESTASVQDLVDLLKDKIGYEDFSIQAGASIIYDPDLEDNLGKSLGEYIQSGNSFLTVVDDGDDERVDLVLSRSTNMGKSERERESGVLRLEPEMIELSSKPKKAPLTAKMVVEGEINRYENGSHAAELAFRASPNSTSANAKRKRDTASDAEEGKVGSAKKRARPSTMGNGEGQDLELIEDNGGIIMLDD